MTTYALPCIFTLFPKLDIQPLLNDICGLTTEQGEEFSEIQIRALIGIMKQAKSAGAINSVSLEALRLSNSGMNYPHFTPNLLKGLPFPRFWIISSLTMTAVSDRIVFIWYAQLRGKQMRFRN